jgi:hypothetical protein
MIARLRPAARLAQSLGAARSSYCVASTSYTASAASSHQRSISSSSAIAGPFSPSSIQFKKSKSEQTGTLANEEVLEDEEEEDLFAISGEEVKKTTKKAEKPTIREVVPFQDTYETLSEKLKYMQPEESVDVQLSDWKLLVESASTEEDLRQCLSIAKEWKRLTYNIKSKLQRMTVNETRILVKQARILGHREFMYGIVMDRKNCVLDFDLDIVRTIQNALVYRLGSKSRDLYIESVSMKAATAGEKSTGEVESTSIVNREKVKMSDIDRILTLAASTCLFSSSQVDVDGVTLLMALSGIVKCFKLHRLKTPKQDDFHKSQLYPVLAQSLIAFCTTKQDGFKGTFPRRASEKGIFKEYCQFVRRAMSSHGDYSAKEHGVDVNKVMSRLNEVESEAMTSDVGVNTKDDFNPLAESTI